MPTSCQVKLPKCNQFMFIADIFFRLFNKTRKKMLKEDFKTQNELRLLKTQQCKINRR